jgi:hypothetical protein
MDTPDDKRLEVWEEITQQGKGHTVTLDITWSIQQTDEAIWRRKSSEVVARQNKGQKNMLYSTSRDMPDNISQLMEHRETTTVRRQADKVERHIVSSSVELLVQDENHIFPVIHFMHSLHRYYLSVYYSKLPIICVWISPSLIIHAWLFLHKCRHVWTRLSFSFRVVLSASERGLGWEGLQQTCSSSTFLSVLYGQ